MFRIFPLLAIALGSCLSSSSVGQAVDPASPTAAYAESRQNSDGGFTAEPGSASTLGSTTSAARVLRFEGGSIRDPLKCIDYVKSCFDQATGGFGDQPGKAPTVGSTASGLMAMGELKIDDEGKISAAQQYLEENAKEFPDVRIAVAGLESVRRKSEKFAEWTRLIEGMRGDEPTWGEGDSEAFETGGATAALLRMGVNPDHRDEIVEAIRNGQTLGGAWAKQGSGPFERGDLSTTCRIMRAMFMLGEKPSSLEDLTKFIASCRHENGAYSDTPEGEPSLGATYMAGIITRWARLLDGVPATIETAGFKPLLAGPDLSDWDGDKSLWFLQDGVLIGKTKGLDHNEFLAHKEPFGDFILKVSFRLGEAGNPSDTIPTDSKGMLNSGIQFRSERLPGTEMIGYQADIGEGFWGCLYDESRRNKTLVQASQDATANIHKDGWNQYVIRAIGPQISLSLNDRTSAQYKEEDESIARSGRIGLQLHAGAPLEMRFKDLYVQRLPSPVADDLETPGFHVRTVEAEGGPRKYVVYLPQGYDRTKKYPVVLFLHGSGERGEDGIVPCQVGLGPSILATPERFPVIAVFPQARGGWNADTPDAAAALAALDQVLEDEACDPDRIILTGLSMGGFGTWEIAAAHPERFAAISPVCGPPRTASAEDVKHLPIWTFVGDDDNPRLVQGLRQIETALRETDAELQVTEYRGVGHNSWDRAYSDPAWIDWILARRRSEQ
jgi:dienelactone hydrolase/prenyltransferase beta subunit